MSNRDLSGMDITQLYCRLSHLREELSDARHQIRMGKQWRERLEREIEEIRREMRRREEESRRGTQALCESGSAERTRT